MTCPVAGPLLTCPWCGISVSHSISSQQISHLITCGDRTHAQLATAQREREDASTWRREDERIIRNLEQKLEKVQQALNLSVDVRGD